MIKGIKLKQLRNNVTLSQTEAARRLGISKQTLYKYEKDIVTNIPSDVVERMAKLYETTPAYLMGWEDETGNKTPERQLLDIYARNIAKKQTDEADQMILDLLHNVSPEAKDSFVQLLKSLQPQSELPRLHSKKD